MPSTKRLKYGLPIASGALLALVGAASAQSNLTKADHTPQACDLQLDVGDLARLTAPKASKKYKLEISVPSLSNPYIVSLIYGATVAAGEAGVGLSIDSGSGFLDPASQIRQIENAQSRGFDALLISPADPDGLVATIDDIIDGGTPVIDVGTLSNSTKSQKIVQDDYAQGRAGAELMLKLLPDGGEGIVQGGPANATWARRRIAGFIDGVKENPKIKINAITNQDINPAEGVTKFANAAQANPKVDWIFTVFNLLLPPDSIPPEYKSAVYIGGVYDQVMMAAIKEKTASGALPNLPVAVGYMGVVNAVKKLDGETVPQRICLPSPIVTSENATDPIWKRFEIAPINWQVPAGN